MSTVIPTPEQVAEFKNAWAKADNAGLIGMRTLAGLTAVLNMAAPSTEPKLVALIDSDGDTWMRIEGEADSWHCPSEEYLQPRTHAEVASAFGPLQEVST